MSKRSRRAASHSEERAPAPETVAAFKDAVQMGQAVVYNANVTARQIRDTMLLHHRAAEGLDDSWQFDGARLRWVRRTVPQPKAGAK